MIDAQRLIEQFFGNDPRQTPARQGASQSATGTAVGIPDSFKGFGGGLAAGGLAGLLLGSKGGRKIAGKALKVGGMAVLGGLAYKAYRDWQATKGGNSTVSRQEAEAAAANPVAAAQGTAFLPAPEAQRHDLAVKLIQAMIAAAKADGTIDGEEQKRIFNRLDESDLDVNEKAFLMDELRKPLDIDAIVALAGSTEEAVEIYAASCLAIDPDEAAEKAYLAMLAARLDLAPELVTHIEGEIATATNG